MKYIKSFEDFVNENLNEVEVPFLSLSKKEIETLKNNGKVTKSFSGTKFSHSVDQATIKRYLGANAIEYKDWISGKKIKAKAEVELDKKAGSIHITVIESNENKVNEAKIKSAQDIKGLSNYSDKTGFTEIKINKGVLIISHNGNMGNTIERSVNPNLKISGFPPIKDLKKMFKVKSEEGDPDYQYTIEFSLNEDFVNESKEVTPVDEMSVSSRTKVVIKDVFTDWLNNKRYLDVDESSAIKAALALLDLDDDKDLVDLINRKK